MMRAMPICLGCQHFLGYTTPTGRCAAFPAGVPAAIWTLDADHRQPVAGDGGIRFTPLDDQAARYAAAIFTAQEPPPK